MQALGNFTFNYTITLSLSTLPVSISIRRSNLGLDKCKVLKVAFSALRYLQNFVLTFLQHFEIVTRDYLIMDPTDAGAYINEVVMKPSLKNIFKNIEVLQEKGDFFFDKDIFGVNEIGYSTNKQLQAKPLIIYQILSCMGKV